MLSAFVRGLMCATLFAFGSEAVIRLIGNDLIRHGSASAALWHIPGVIAFVLALLLLFTDWPMVGRFAFGFLLMFAIVNIAVPIWTTLAHTPSPTPKDWSLFYGLLSAFPCVVAVFTRSRVRKNV
jgi:predicted MFS family arabinose efflux permease